MVSNEMMLSYCLPIHNALKDDRRFSFWFCFHDRKRFNKDNIAAIIGQNEFKAVSSKTAAYIPWDLVLYPYHGPYTRTRSKKIYIGHGLNSGKLINGEYMKFNNSSRSADGKIYYDKIFACHESEREMTKTRFPDHYPKMRVVGNLLLDKLLKEAGNRAEILNRCKCDPGRKTVMITGSWGPKSLPQSFDEKLIAEARKLLEQYNVIFSIHQNNFVDTGVNRFDWAKALDKINDKNFFALKKNESAISFLPAADTLIMDHTSAGLFYLFLERPIVFFENNVTLTDDAHISLLKKAAYNIHSIDHLTDAVANAFDEFDLRRARETAGKVCDHVGSSWERYKEEIFDSLGID